ncbi:hypothetical protein [Novosphingobium sp. AP12]|uniref:phage tail assembly chaperone n=1 Tax=Novosphingobium sp. AP12 TaxID=1144305 RepID=UPI000271FFBD|nr:hypothetical protein [Novosphingobium sp. AP12]EJL34124.1 hypothetical protein PMI02_00789 [Novosphingobium sp. AP12]
MTLYVRQLAWLNATPKPPEGSKRAQAKDLPRALPRAEQLKKDRIVPQMPPNPAPHILSRLFEIGLTEAAGMGAGPLSWQSIKAWQDVIGVSLSRWEARLLRKLSVEYLAEGHRAESENCPPPWRAEVSAREMEVELARLQLVLG